MVEGFSECLWTCLEAGAPLSLGILELAACPELDYEKLRAQLRPSDCLYQVGARYLIALLPDSPVRGARRVMERLASVGPAEAVWPRGAVQVEPSWTFTRAVEEALRRRSPERDGRRAGRATPGCLTANLAWSDLCDLVGWLGTCGRSGRLSIQAADLRGRLHLHEGRVAGAATWGGRLRGRAAALALLDVQQAQVEFEPCACDTGVMGCLNLEPTQLLLEVARVRDERDSRG